MKKFYKMCVIALVSLGFTFTSLWAISNHLTPETFPSSLKVDGAIVQVYGANVWGVRGYFAIHTWIATKSEDENEFTIHQIIGWKLRRNKTALTISSGNPARPWFGSAPILLHEITGEKAGVLIPKIREAVHTYPYADTYTMWPGPNSNSFTEWVTLEVPELGFSLPAKAIGKSWMKDHYTNQPLARSPLE